MDILFVDKIPFLITLSQKIDLTAEIQFSTHKAIDIFKSFLWVYVFYLKCDFIIITIHADGELAPMWEPTA